jgi:hypothetical protein
MFIVLDLSHPQIISLYEHFSVVETRLLSYKASRRTIFSNINDHINRNFSSMQIQLDRESPVVSYRH